MRATWRLLPIWCVLASAAAQEPVRVVPEAEPGPKALQRATEDAQAACRNLLALPHAFTGTVRFGALSKPATSDAAEITFRGGWHNELELLQLGKHTVLKHGDREIVSAEGGPWTLPQGDSPNCPLSPVVLAKHLGTATIDAWEPTSHCDRPAIRVHATWTGDAAERLLHEVNHPDTQSQALLERLPIIQQRQAAKMVVDASVCVDPASRSLYSAVLRLAVLEARDRREEDPPLPCAEGLPALRRSPLLEYTFTFNVLDPNQVPMPDLDPSMQQRLAWPPAPSPSAPAPPAPTPPAPAPPAPAPPAPPTPAGQAAPPFTR